MTHDQKQTRHDSGEISCALQAEREHIAAYIESRSDVLLAEIESGTTRPINRIDAVQILVNLAEKIRSGMARLPQSTEGDMAPVGEIVADGAQLDIS